MSTSVISRAEPFFLKVLSVLDQSVPDTQELFRLRRQLMADLAEIEHKVNIGETGLSGGDWDTVKRVLVYWADEVLTDHTREWSEQTLEHAYFGVQDRAFEFYTLGERTYPTAGSEIAEIFYLAIVLGFKGRIDEAFIDHLGQDMPGQNQGREQIVRDKARRHWARQLQQRIRHQAVGEVLGEPLEGDVESADKTAFFRTALAAFVIALLLFGIALCWYYEVFKQ